MPQARLQLTVPKSVWIGQLTRAHPESRFRILGALADDATGVGLVEVHSPDLDAVLEDFRTQTEVTELEVFQRTEDEALAQFETTDPLLLIPARDSGVPVEMPFTVTNGIAVWTVTVPTDRLSELGKQLEGFGITFQVDYVQQEFESQELLTDKQQEIVETAIEAGYYDTPRDCSLTDLAEEFDIAKSTASEMIHRAEGKIMKEYAARSDSELVCDNPDPDCEEGCPACPLKN